MTLDDQRKAKHQIPQFTSDFPLTPFRQAALNLNEKTRREQVRYAYSVAHEVSSVLSQRKKFTNWAHEVSLATHVGLGLWNVLLYFFPPLFKDRVIYFTPLFRHLHQEQK